MKKIPEGRRSGRLLFDILIWRRDRYLVIMAIDLRGNDGLLLCSVFLLTMLYRSKLPGQIACLPQISSDDVSISISH